jgi:formylglycine-generating enzyme required for sulfatase activity
MQTADGAEMWVLSAGVAGFRLPTEDEWERACRWGTTTTFHCSDDESFLPDYARISAASTLPVGSLLPNAGGFYDMHGNVMEWCEPSNGERVGEYAVRGGAFLTGPADSESGFSMRFPGTDRYDLAGFRVVLSE